MAILALWCSSAGAQTIPTPTTVAANTPGTLPDGDDIPSCSLFPTRLGFGRWFFTNRRDFPITLSIITRSTDGISAPIGTEVTVFDGTLGAMQSTPEFILTPDTTIHWAGGTYHLSAYDFVNCFEQEGITTTTPITTPFSVPTTIPITTTQTVPSTTAPSTTTTAPPTTTSTQPPTTITVILTITSFVTIPFNPRPPLANTGFNGVGLLLGVSLLLIGLMFVALSRRDRIYP
jgi:hypothetical protein